jgi:hypothetical protein
MSENPYFLEFANDRKICESKSLSDEGDIVNS